MELILGIVLSVVSLGALALAYLALRKDLSKEYVDQMGKYAQNMTWLALDCYDRGWNRRNEVQGLMDFTNRAGDDNLKNLSVHQQAQDYIAGRDVEPPREPMFAGEVDVTNNSVYDGADV
ncbi:MAG TPA: hypothetical protein VMZ92_21115 [Planctomycetota bacterium]|nr:hypothetical protein [Planctomycetota bacterium]